MFLGAAGAFWQCPWHLLIITSVQHEALVHGADTDSIILKTSLIQLGEKIRVKSLQWINVEPAMLRSQERPLKGEHHPPHCGVNHSLHDGQGRRCQPLLIPASGLCNSPLTKEHSTSSILDVSFGSFFGKKPIVIHTHTFEKYGKPQLKELKSKKQ